MTFETVASLITVLGAGTILGAYFQSQFEHKKQVKEKEHELKHKRYGAILILMLTKLDPKTALPHIHTLRPDLENITDVDSKLKTELLNGVLFASDEVIQTMACFIHKPSYSTYIKTTIAMIRDLWDRKTSIDEKILEAINKT